MSAVMALNAPVAPRSSSERTFGIALAVSLALHAVLLSLHFKYPDASRAFQEKALDIILVNAKSVRAPKDAQALAQTNLDGGGNSEEDRRVKTPLPPAPRRQAGNDVEQAQKRVHALEARQRQLLAQARRAKAAVAPVKEAPEREPQPVAEALPTGLDLVSQSMEMARLEGQISRQTEEYNKRPRVGRLTSARVREYRFARYVDDWRKKVERIGTLNYPDAARGKIYGNLVLSVRLRRDGSVERIDIDRSSGSRVLDDAARRVVRMAEPFANFPPDIARDFDILEITRTWTFTKGSQVATTN